jgi:drug/metabolite transporter (DMT)-like permease
MPQVQVFGHAIVPVLLARAVLVTPTHRKIPPARMSSTSSRAGSTWTAYLILALAVVIVSSSSILIRFAQADGVPSLAIAAWRMTLAAIILSGIVAGNPHARRKIAACSKADYALALAAGIFLALHFASWIASLGYTSVASSTALVTTNPVWIALASWLLFREKLGSWLIVGIAAAVGGSMLIFWSDARSAAGIAGSNPLLGNSLALIGSLTVCGYLLIGRRLRRTMSLLPYIFLVYSAAALVLVVTAAVSGTALFGYTTLAWVCLAGLALGPQLLGHSGINWSLKHIPATFIAIAILGEPVSAALMAWAIFGEGFATLQLAGFALLLAGIYIASRDRSSS